MYSPNDVSIYVYVYGSNRVPVPGISNYKVSAAYAVRSRRGATIHNTQNGLGDRVVVVLGVPIFLSSEHCIRKRGRGNRIEGDAVSTCGHCQNIRLQFQILAVVVKTCLRSFISAGHG